MKRLLLIAITALLLGSAWAGDFEDGVAAYNRKDYVQALKKYKSSAAKGNAAAQSNLGAMYGNGQGVAQDYAEAVKWYRLAATQGNAGAQFNLGLMYHKGHGVAEDYVRAHMWSNLGAINGDTSALTIRDYVASKMTSQQIGEAQKMARECQQRKFKGCD